MVTTTDGCDGDEKSLSKSTTSFKDIRVVHSYYKVGRNDSIGIKGFNSSKKIPPMGLDLMQEIITGLRV